MAESGGVANDFRKHGRPKTPWLKTLNRKCRRIPAGIDFARPTAKRSTPTPPSTIRRSDGEKQGASPSMPAYFGCHCWHASP